MSSKTPAVFEKTLEESVAWLEDLGRLAGEEDPQRALRLLRVGLHSTRDRLTADEAAHLGAQMPMLIRGLYFEGWRPANKPVKEHTREAFLAHVRGAFENDPPEEDEKKIRAVFRLLEQRISGGEIDDVKNALPKQIRALWPGKA